jgi:hypothetical protein
VNCDPSWKVTASLIVRERCVPGATPFIYALYLRQNRFVRFVSAFEWIVGRELTETAPALASAMGICPHLFFRN